MLGSLLLPLSPLETGQSTVDTSPCILCHIADNTAGRCDPVSTSIILVITADSCDLVSTYVMK